MTEWGDLAVRARGLGTHLLTREQLGRLAASPDPAALAAACAREGIVVVDEAARDPAALDLAIRRRAAARLRVLGRWGRDRPAVLQLLFEELDRENLRALVRGAVAGVNAAARLAACVPTPALPERALAALAAQPDVPRVAALLRAWQSPYGPPLAEAAGTGQPDPLALQLALDRTWATRAARTARALGGLMRAHVRLGVDLANAVTALALAGRAGDLAPAEAFLEGGHDLPRATFEAACRARDATLAAAPLAACWPGTPIGRCLAAAPGDLAALDRCLLGARLARARRAERLDPSGPAPLLHFLLRLRAEAFDLRRIAWGIALGAPAPRLHADLVTA